MRGRSRALVKFYLPDSQDHVDPSFDFETEKRGVMRRRQRDDLYAHEVFRTDEERTANPGD